MPAIMKTSIDGIDLWVRQGQQAAWDIGTSRAVIVGDEYALRPFLDSPIRDQVRTVVDIGANIGAFTLAARRVFARARVLAVEADPANLELLRCNCGQDDQVTIAPVAVLGDDCPRRVHLCRHQLNSGGAYVRELYQSQTPPFVDAAPIEIDCWPVHELLSCHGVDEIDVLKVDAEGSEVDIFTGLADHGWLHRTRWIRFEWHGHAAIPRLRRLLETTHQVSINDKAMWNALGIAHRKEIA